MSQKVLFLSHIHEEAELAKLLKDELESEFGGFVDVFVSSDGQSIPAGANFLKRIEDGLVACVSAIYLVSPTSVKRSWISFELGAVWLRNVMSIRAGQAEIPTIPFCHSGAAPNTLPAPLNNLNGITANQPSQLEFAFKSIQTAVGGKGGLRTDFDKLAANVLLLEQRYTLGTNLKTMLQLIGPDLSPIVLHADKQPAGQSITIDCGMQPTEVVTKLKHYEATHLKGHITVFVDSPGVAFGPNGAINGANTKVVMLASLVVRFRSLLLQA